MESGKQDCGLTLDSNFDNGIEFVSPNEENSLLQDVDEKEEYHSTKTSIFITYLRQVTKCHLTMIEECDNESKESLV